MLLFVNLWMKKSFSIAKSLNFQQYYPQTDNRESQYPQPILYSFLNMQIYTDDASRRRVYDRWYRGTISLSLYYAIQLLQSSWGFSFLEEAVQASSNKESTYINSKLFYALPSTPFNQRPCTRVPSPFYPSNTRQPYKFRGKREIIK